MVEVGELTITGSIDEKGIIQGLDRIDNRLGNLENQFNQVEPSAKRVGGSIGIIAKTLTAIGITGVAAITALSVKSPVLANTMAKMEVETLKLSNTVGREMRPIFQTIANELIPSVNSAFARNSEEIGYTVTNVSKLIEVLSDLISLDFTELKSDVRDVFANITEQTDSSTGQSIISETQAATNMSYGENLFLKFSGLQMFTKFTDSLLSVWNTYTGKEQTISTATGVSRG